MRISERGQVTIPRTLREQFGLTANTEVDFVPDGNGLRLMASSSAKIAEVGALYGRKSFAKGTDQLMALLRE